MALMLHALHVARGAPKEAAAAILRHARRLGEAVTAISMSTPARSASGVYGGTRGGTGGDARARLADALEAHAGALLAAINALRLCPPGARFVTEEWRSCERKLRELTIDGEAGDDDGDGSRDENENPKKESIEKSEGGVRGRRAPPHPKRRRRVAPPPETTSLSRLLREYALVASRLELCVAGADVSESLGSSDESSIPGTVAQLCAHGLFQSATKLACSWCEGEALNELVTVIAATLAARAALAQTSIGTSIGSNCEYAIDRALGAAAGAAAAALGEAVAASDEPIPRSATASLASAGGVLGGDELRPVNVLHLGDALQHLFGRNEVQAPAFIIGAKIAPGGAFRAILPAW